MNRYVERMIRAAKLDAEIYEEVEADKSAMGQAMGVVVMSSIAAGIGSGGMSAILPGTLFAIIGWFVWAAVIYVIGTRLLPEPQTESNMGELLRTIGFASSPGLIRIIGIIPFLRGIVFFASSVWMLAAMVIAVRQALDYQKTSRAIGVCVIGWLVQGLILFLFFLLMGGGPAPEQAM